MGISEVLCDYNAPTASEKFFDTLQTSYDKSFPIKSKMLKAKKNKKPWITEEHLASMTTRDKLQKA